MQKYKINFKTTYFQQYLLFISSQQKHSRNNFPPNLAKRICTMHSNATQRDHRLVKLNKYSPRENTLIKKANKNNKEQRKHGKIHIQNKKLLRKGYALYDRQY